MAEKSKPACCGSFSDGSIHLYGEGISQEKQLASLMALLGVWVEDDGTPVRLPHDHWKEVLKGKRMSKQARQALLDEHAEIFPRTLERLQQVCRGEQSKLDAIAMFIMKTHHADTGA